MALAAHRGHPCPPGRDRIYSPDAAVQPLELTQTFAEGLIEVDWYWTPTEAARLNRGVGYEAIWLARGFVKNLDKERVLILGGAKLDLLSHQGIRLASADVDLDSNIPVGNGAIILPGTTHQVFVEAYTQPELIELVERLEARVWFEFFDRDEARGALAVPVRQVVKGP